ncbi:MAG: His/Gly/Thr/Pro-type tRNA ligase C-terminal domain-containing protein [Patescibacteria group bacterium]|nr:His/Gly/Thr/Pro-type tRNA ligase C-terminal domain-containing protein [Patescibacteria group bacterium]
MLQSKLFLRTQNESPKDEVAINAQLLIRGNFIHKLMAGAYSYLPLGFRVREKVIKIIREEMNALGAAELLMPALHPRSIWDMTGRWEGLSKIMYQFKDHSGRELGLGPTHEEVVSLIAKSIIFSYNDLPLSVYQIQTKFRDEPRPKSGLLRGREFTMKDLYSFHTDQDSLNEFYEEAKKAYHKVFSRCGLKSYATEASGGDFSKEISHEFMVESGAGEDMTMICRLCGWAQNKSISEFKAGGRCLKCSSGVLEEMKSIEVGNIFKLGAKYSEPFSLNYKDKKGELRPVVMGCYGIGVERIIGTVVEVYHDEKGIIWPETIAPLSLHLLLIGEVKPPLKKFATQVYNWFMKEGVEVLFDDRENVSAGEKFVDADLIGLPRRLVVSEKTMVQESVELKERSKKEIKLIKLKELSKIFKK